MDCANCGDEIPVAGADFCSQECLAHFYGRAIVLTDDTPAQCSHMDDVDHTYG